MVGCIILEVISYFWLSEDIRPAILAEDGNKILQIKVDKQAKFCVYSNFRQIQNTTNLKKLKTQNYMYICNMLYKPKSN